MADSDRIKVLEDTLLKLLLATRDGSAYGVHRNAAHPIDALIQAMPGGADVMKKQPKVARQDCTICGASVPVADMADHLACHKAAMEAV